MRRQPRNRGGQYKHSAVYNWRKKKNRAWSDYQPYAVAIFGLITWLIFAQIIPVYAHIQNETGYREILNSYREPLKVPSQEARTEGNHDEPVSADSDSLPRESDDGGTDDVPTPSSSVEEKIKYYFPLRFEKAKAVFTCESGLDPKKPSAVDKMADGRAFSFGLAQINLTVSEIGGVDCSKAFVGRNSNAKVVDEPLYTTCVALAEDADLNLQAAQKKQHGNVDSWGAWSWCHNKTK